MRLSDAVSFGAIFAGCVLIGLVAGIRVAARTGSSLWVVAGLFIGFVAGAVVVARRMGPLLK
ncbi:MAG: hypothetical protein ACREM6_00105 [Vulcanimicrobiaceae bacterium]